MTPGEWYKSKRDLYKERYMRDWFHLSMYGDNQNSAVCETAMRAGIECVVLKPTSVEEIEMIANAIIIRDLLIRRLNSY